MRGAEGISARPGDLSGHVTVTVAVTSSAAACWVMSIPFKFNLCTSCCTLTASRVTRIDAAMTYKGDLALLLAVCVCVRKERRGSYVTPGAASQSHR